MSRTRGKVVVAMSGGVDSSVAAALLKDDGYDVVGCFMRLGSVDSVEGPDDAPPVACDPTSGGTKKNRQGCCSVNDAADARFVAAMLDVPFYVLNFKADFGRVMDYFVDDYNAGRTPNPCVRCNDWLKFGKMVDYAKSIDADYIASGHYAQTETNADKWGTPHAVLLRGVDHHKDQSYVLFGTKQDRLDRMILPVGRYHKADVRKMAEQMKLPVFDKPDSYEICFVPDNDYRGFVERRTPEAVQPGPLRDVDGNDLGEHAGHQHYTVGQRRGLPVATGRPMYVVEKDAATNVVTLGDKADLMSQGLVANQVNWLIDPPAEPLRCTIKVRSNSDPVPGEVVATCDDELRVTFDEPQEAVAAGQAAVCYVGERLVGGGWILNAK